MSILSPLWVSLEFRKFDSAVPNGTWLFRVMDYGWPTIRVIRITDDSTSIGRKLLWEGGGGSRRRDPKWAHMDITHYAPLEAFAEVVKEITT